MRATLLLGMMAAAASGCGAAGAGGPRLTGCAAGEEATRRGPVEEPAAAAAWVRAAGDRLTFDGPIDHACCLEGSVDVERSEGRYDVLVTLRGEPCRCMCQSRLVAEGEPLPPGRYHVRLLVDGRVTAEGDVELSGP